MVSAKIRESLTRRANDFFIDLEDVSITHFSFSPEFTSAIESKQVGMQSACVVCVCFIDSCLSVCLFSEQFVDILFCTLQHNKKQSDQNLLY
jgi:hypothetical protein